MSFWDPFLLFYHLSKLMQQAYSTAQSRSQIPWLPIHYAAWLPLPVDNKSLPGSWLSGANPAPPTAIGREQGCPTRCSFVGSDSEEKPGGTSQPRAEERRGRGTRNHQFSASQEKAKWDPQMQQQSVMFMPRYKLKSQHRHCMQFFFACSRKMNLNCKWCRNGLLG